MAKDKSEILQGTLDLMILRTLEMMGPQHGWGIARRLEQVSEDGGRTWTEKLFLMQPTRVTTIDGSTLHDNEIALERRNP